MDQSTPHQESTSYTEETNSIFSAETAAAIRQYTCKTLAKDFNLPSLTLENLLQDQLYPTKNVGMRFISRRLRDFA